MTPARGKDPQKAANRDVLAAAMTYHRRGWAVIPCTGKRAAFKWKQYQHTRPAEEDVLKWFSKPHNIGVICGPVSGGLTCRDFDDPDAYDRWAAAYPDLARLLPTVKTSRGFHVYFVSGLDSIQHLPDNSGELRGGGYCLLPPSVHPDGPQYRWIIEPNGKIPEVDFRIFRPDATERLTPNDITAATENTEENGEDRENVREQRRIEENTSNENCFSVALFQGTAISEIIQKSLPTTEGQRNQKLFFLARLLKSQPGFQNADTATLRAIVRQWHNRAADVIGTKEFLTSWADFLYGWQRVKFAANSTPVRNIIERLISGKITPPAEIVRDYPGETGLAVLAGLCRELARLSGPDGGFFLSCRTPADMLKIDPSTVNRWLKILIVEGMIEEVKKGHLQGRRATRWRYLKEK